MQIQRHCVIFDSFFEYTFHSSIFIGSFLVGLLVFSVAGLLVMCAALVACLAWRHADWRAFAIADAPEQRALLRRHRGRLTLGQTMALVSLANWFTAVTQWYATPPDRTPPLIQSVFNALVTIAAAPASRL